ncbi:reverse transcriptase domain-containing protein [Tanacetum coccineum]
MLTRPLFLLGSAIRLGCQPLKHLLLHWLTLSPFPGEALSILTISGNSRRLRTQVFCFGGPLSVVGCYLLLVTPFFFSFCQRDRIHVLGDEEFRFFFYQYFLRGSAGREFLEKSKHFSHPTIDPLALLENGILKSFHSFAFMVIEGEVLNDFPRFVGVLIAEFATDGTDIANITRKQSKPDKHRHENGKSAQEPGEYDGKEGAVVYSCWIEKMESVQEGAVGMSWDNFKVLMREEFCPSNEVHKLETELWNYAVVDVGHVAYTDRFHELAKLVPHLVTPQNRRIERYIAGTLTNEALRNGSIKKNPEKKGNRGEPSKDRNGRDDNKRTRTGNAFATTVMVSS